MDTLEKLTERLATTEEIQDIVKTMKSLSAASIRQFETAADALESYQQTVELGLQVMLKDLQLADPPGAPSAREGLIVIGSDRGLCGRFNRKVASVAVESLHEKESGERPLLAVGGRVAALLEANGHVPDVVFSTPGSARAITRTAQDILIHLDNWRADGIARVQVISNRRVRQMPSQTGIVQLAPIPGPDLRRLAQAKWNSRSLPIFTLERTELLSWLTREWLFIGLQRAIAASLASEHAARLAAMQAAERSIEERLEEIRQRTRQVRQESITTELQDIVTGYEASRRQR